MGLLKSEPAEIVRSLSELMAIAQAMEDEAAVRYGQLAARMRHIGNPSVAAVFDRLALEEQSHAANVTQWSQEVVGRAPDPADIEWELPQTLDEDEMADLATSRTVTPYRALAIAVRNEERAFAFWSYVSAHAESDAVRAQAEAIALEELRHVSLLREERRRAYHAERGTRAGSAPDARTVSAGRLAMEAVGIETRIHGLCGAAATSFARDGDARTSGLLGRVADESAANVRSLGQRVSGAGGSDGMPPEPEAMPVGALDAVLRALDAASERYLQVAEATRDEDLLRLAQDLSGSAIRRLALLRERRSELRPFEREDEP